MATPRALHNRVRITITPSDMREDPGAPGESDPLSFFDKVMQELRLESEQGEQLRKEEVLRRGESEDVDSDSKERCCPPLVKKDVKGGLDTIRPRSQQVVAPGALHQTKRQQSVSPNQPGSIATGRQHQKVSLPAENNPSQEPTKGRQSLSPRRDETAKKGTRSNSTQRQHPPNYPGGKETQMVKVSPPSPAKSQLDQDHQSKQQSLSTNRPGVDVNGGRKSSAPAKILAPSDAADSRFLQPMSATACLRRRRASAADAAMLMSKFNDERVQTREDTPYPHGTSGSEDDQTAPGDVTSTLLLPGVGHWGGRRASSPLIPIDAATLQAKDSSLGVPGPAHLTRRLSDGLSLGQLQSRRLSDGPQPGQLPPSLSDVSGPGQLPRRLSDGPQLGQLPQCLSDVSGPGQLPRRLSDGNSKGPLGRRASATSLMLDDAYKERSVLIGRLDQAQTELQSTTPLQRHLQRRKSQILGLPSMENESSSRSSPVETCSRSAEDMSSEVDDPKLRRASPHFMPVHDVNTESLTGHKPLCRLRSKSAENLDQVSQLTMPVQRHLQRHHSQLISTKRETAGGSAGHRPLSRQQHSNSIEEPVAFTRSTCWSAAPRRSSMSTLQQLQTGGEHWKDLSKMAQAASAVKVWHSTADSTTSAAVPNRDGRRNSATSQLSLLGAQRSASALSAGKGQSVFETATMAGFKGASDTLQRKQNRNPGNLLFPSSDGQKESSQRQGAPSNLEKRALSRNPTERLKRHVSRMTADWTTAQWLERAALTEAHRKSSANAKHT